MRESAERRAFHRRTLRIARIDFHDPAEAKRFVELPRQIEA
jgi:hypothetical protein